MMDRFSKSVHFVSLEKNPFSLRDSPAPGVPCFSNPRHSYWHCLEQRTTFVSQVWRTFCDALGVDVSLTSGYHPQFNSQTKCYIQELEVAIRCIINKNPSSRNKHLTCVEYALNSHTSFAIGLPPFEVSLGYSPPLFPSIETDILVPAVQAHIQTKQALLRTADQNKTYTDCHRSVAPTYRRGQKVWLFIHDINLHAPETCPELH